MFTSSICDYSDAYILVKGTITVAGEWRDAAAIRRDKVHKQTTSKNCAKFTNCISKINNTQVDNAKNVDLVMQTCNLIEYSDSYSKTFESLYQFCRDESKSPFSSFWTI